MLQQLISLNQCLQKLQLEGYSLEVRGGYLVIHHVPYLDSEKHIKEGALFMTLNLSGHEVLKPVDHTAFWKGEIPYEFDGSKISALINRSETRSHGEGLMSNYFLSCKPDKECYVDENYPTYYEKVKTYCNRISTPAYMLDKYACEKIRNQIVESSSDSIFVYPDTNSTKADVAALSDMFLEQKVAIIGLGGTGSYLLDFLAKMPLREIHIYDDDCFNSHNAFRCPGAASLDALNQCEKKVDYLRNVYSNMHKGIFAHPCRITSANLTELDAMDFVFICVDKVDVRNLIASHLINCQKPFIDSGLGIIKHSNGLSGQIRVTTGFANNYDHIACAFGRDVEIDDEYASNIQIAELNALAAILMVVKWKRLMNYYMDGGNCDDNMVYAISTNEIR